jgi:hypothetical protein
MKRGLGENMNPASLVDDYCWPNTLDRHPLLVLYLFIIPGFVFG